MKTPEKALATTDKPKTANVRKNTSPDICPKINGIVSLTRLPRACPINAATPGPGISADTAKANA